MTKAMLSYISNSSLADLILFLAIVFILLSIWRGRKKTIKKRPTVAIDFDGVIHSYVTPWEAPHVIPDGPISGSLFWLNNNIDEFDIVILSTRCRTWRGRRAIRRWLRIQGGLIYWHGAYSRGLKHVRCSYGKLPAWVYIDDRAYRFTGPGSLPTAAMIHRTLKPWNKPNN